ncbi:DUF6691 family protein [Bauldia sp.]|uniref:DUF6691 family protein n=1 Tax=Bauldia sp. TaxID=2575872 RepID=UPI0025C3FA83|nr:DUF6691 family protein [Bauldia sp.]
MRRSVIAIAAAFGSGIIFGLGLAIARMIDPQKVRDFLDFAAIPDGGWDPSLAFVMGGGVLVAFVGLRLNRVLARPIVAPAFQTTAKTRIDSRLVGGAAIFGIGWGLSGFCPAPAIANLGIVPQSVMLFVAAMLAGSWLTGEIAEWARKPMTPKPQAVAG